MTKAGYFKARVRTRMARTGERYAVARAHAVGSAVDTGPVLDTGWALRGGADPDTAALTNVLAHHRVGLEQAAVVLDEPRLADEAPRWREIADRWHVLAETALPDDVPAIARLRTLTAIVTGAVAEGDAGAADRAAAAEGLWRLRAEHSVAPPLDEERIAAVLAGMSGHLAAIHDAETAAVTSLRAALSG